MIAFIAFVAGWLVGAACLALFIGAVVQLADAQRVMQDQPQVKPAPLYVPSGWVA